jgi:hypothetical protein
LAEREAPGFSLPESPAPSMTGFLRGLLERTARMWTVGTKYEQELQAILDVHGVEACVKAAGDAVMAKLDRGEGWANTAYIVAVLRNLPPPRRNGGPAAPDRQAEFRSWFHALTPEQGKAYWDERAKALMDELAKPIGGTAEQEEARCNAAIDAVDARWRQLAAKQRATG